LRPSQAEVNKHGTALAADVWNSLKTVNELETFLIKGKKKADQAEIKKILSQLKVKPAAVFVNRESVQFGTSETKWSLDVEGGVWVNGKLFVAKEGSSIGETLKQYKVWKKQNVKTSMMSLWVPSAYAQTQSGLEPADDAAYVTFMTEFGQLMNRPCLYQMAGEALKKIAEKSPEGAEPKITTMAIICSDQNPNKETIYGAASGSNIAIMMNGEYANSPSTSKSYLKKVRISLNGENRVNVNFIESATGSDVHTMEVKPPGGKTEVLDKNQIQSKSTIACTAELAQRMITTINTVCDNRKASGYVQKSLGQTSGPAPAKAGAAAGSEAQAK
tara:strand:- start:3492 stop:4484 length:993 start_codon:yes stop_codon:yes gene_type:complete